MDAAREAATRRRLVLDGMTEAKADAWIAAWDAEAARDGWSAVRPIGRAAARLAAESR